MGVNAVFLRQGIGTLVLKHALEITKRRNAKFLRLLVSTVNEAAINLYRKNGFTQVTGIYNEFSESLNNNIMEFGFELER
ncbi:MAG: GNAT family N-acetyltransferase [Alphaproteobacteria bacterium]|nr:GNAT family N-acetyltransferase [Alphaproteobacteria bacterium]